MSVFICPLACLKSQNHISKLREIFNACWLRPSNNNAMCYILPVLWMTFYIIEPIDQDQRQHYVSSSSPDGGTESEVAVYTIAGLFLMQKNPMSRPYATLSSSVLHALLMTRYNSCWRLKWNKHIFFIRSDYCEYLRLCHFQSTFLAAQTTKHVCTHALHWVLGPWYVNRPICKVTWDLGAVKEV